MGLYGAELSTGRLIPAKFFVCFWELWSTNTTVKCVMCEPGDLSNTSCDQNKQQLTEAKQMDLIFLDIFGTRCLTHWISLDN